VSDKKGPPIPFSLTGPNCGEILCSGCESDHSDEYVAEQCKGPGPLGPCPFRSTSFGFAPGVGDLHNSRYMFILEALGATEVEEGRPAVGGTGRVLNKLLYANTTIVRSREYVTNVVKCRPVEWTTDEEGKQVPATRDYNGDHINATPSHAQIRECSKRYLEEEIASFKGSTIVGLGGVPLYYFTRGAHNISRYRGTIFESGELVGCSVCGATGRVSKGNKRCSGCKGQGITYIWDMVQSEAICDKHRAKPSRRCETCKLQYGGTCSKCTGLGSVSRGETGCKPCKGVGRVPAQPDNPYISDRIPYGKRLFVTYHPAYIMKELLQIGPIVNRDFQRLGHLDEELAASVLKENYIIRPSNGWNVAQSWGDVPISIDIEGPNAETFEGPITVVGFSPGPGRAMALDPKDPAVGDLLNRPIIGQNYLLYDAWILTHREGFPAPKWLWDTRQAGHLLNPDAPHNIVDMAAVYADPPVRGYWKSRVAGKYAGGDDLVVCQDVDVTYRIKLGQEKQLAQQGLISFMEKEVIPISLLSLDMRLNGMRIDHDKMVGAAGRIGTRLESIRQSLPDWGGIRTENQHEKLRDHLYQNLKAPVQVSRKTGKPSTEEESLVVLRDRIRTGHLSCNRMAGPARQEALELIEVVLSLRGLSKLKSSFLSYRGPLVHPAWNPSGTVTFRFSCSDPNIQQVPDCDCEKAGRRKTDDPCRGSDPNCLGARYIFLPDEPGWKFGSADLKQAEIVGFLWWAEAWEVLRRVLCGREDAHQVISDLTGLIRKDAKNTTFAILFGEQDYTTAARIHKTIQDIRIIREQYYKMLPGVPEYFRSVMKESADKGYVESPFGLRRHVRLDLSMINRRAVNQAANAKIQNIPPIVTRRAMIELARTLPKPSRILGQVHDELLFTYPIELEKEVLANVYETLHQPIPEMSAPPLGMAGGIRFNVDLAVGENWGSLQKYTL